MTPFATYNFTGTAGQELPTADANWTKVGSSGSVILIGNGRARSDDGVAFGRYYRSESPEMGDYAADLTFYVATNAGTLGTFVREDPSSSDKQYFGCYQDGAGWNLYYEVPGVVQTQIGTAVPETLATGVSYRIRTRVVGSSVRLYTRGPGSAYWILRAAATHALADAGRAVGVLGYGALTDGTGRQFDQFDAYDEHELVAAEAAYSREFTVVVDGDSINSNFGLPGTKSIASLLAEAWNSGMVAEICVPGQTAQQVGADLTTQVGPIVPAMSGYLQQIYYDNSGINSLAAGSSLDSLLSDKAAIYTAAKALGPNITVAMPTIIRASSVTGAAETIRQQFNARMVAASPGTYFDYRVPLDGDAAFASTADTEWYQADGTHLTVKGRRRVVDLIVATIPKRVVTSNPYIRQA